MWCSAAKVVLGAALGLLWHAEPLLKRAGISWHGIAAAVAAGVPFNGGTGFFINTDGDFISAFHVIDGCPRPALQTPEGIVVGKLIAKSEELDIAVIRTAWAGEASARFPDHPVQWLMEPVAIGRYRACGGLSSWSVTTATATSMLPVEQGLLALAAAEAIEAGNSGSPVIGRNGDVAGMMVGRLARVSETGIAVDATAITRFLSLTGVRYQTVPSVFFLAPESSGAAAAQYTFPVLCLQ